MTQENIKFTHKLYPEEKCVLLPNSKFMKVDIPHMLCWRFESSMIIRMSSCLDARFYPPQELLKQLGY